MTRSSLNRRQLVAGLAGTGAIGGVLWSLGTSNANNGSNTDDTRSWAERTSQGIQAHRTTDLTVEVRNAEGEPVPDATVNVEMQAHEFQFGTAVNAPRLLEAGNDAYREQLLDLFNTTVLENKHKWAVWEKDAAVADNATAWLRDHGLAVRGHAAIWQHLEHDVVPPDVVSRLDEDASDHAAYLKDRIRTHIRDILSTYAGDINDWDVVNEQLHHSAITDALAPDVPPEKSPPVADWFRIAAQSAPEADLYINDYDIVTGTDPEQTAYETLAEYLLDAGAPIDGVGLQAHFHSRSEAVDPREFRALLDRYASQGLSVKVTEYDTTGDDWTEQEEANHLKTVLKTLYSHPAAEGFLMWGFWDGEHWRNNAPLFRKDWSEKPAYNTYTQLVFEEWWTDDRGETDTSGRYRTQAFLGDYEISVTVGGESTTMTTSLGDSTSETVEVRLS